MKGCTTEQEADNLIDLLRHMLMLDPAERPSALQLLEAHTWLGDVSVMSTVS
jgi:serine/threonine protein kinase